MVPEKVFDDVTRRTIQALRLRLRAARSGEGGASVVSRSLGRGREFHDHRAYLSGDDHRHIDWNLYGRLGELFVKRFRAEADLELRILLDRSASMALGEPQKARVAARMAGALAALLAEATRDVELRLLRPGLPQVGPTVRSPGDVELLFGAIEELPEPEGVADLRAAAPALNSARNRLVIVLSDFLDDQEALARVLAARAARCELHLVTLLAPTELDFEGAGLIDFEDAEDGSRLTLAVDDEMITRYRRLLEDKLERVEALAAARGAVFQLLRSDVDLAEGLRRLALRGGLAR